MGTALEFLKKLFTNKYFWYVLGALLVFLIIRKYWGKVERLFQPSDIELEEGETGKLTASTESTLKTVAAGLYSDLYDTPITGHNLPFYKAVNDLSDTELKFLAKYYRKNLTQGVYLYSDIDDDWFPFTTNVDSMLMAHLAKIGEKGA